MKKYRLIKTDTVELYNKNIKGLPYMLSTTVLPETPTGYAYVEDIPFPEETVLPESKVWSRVLTVESYDWVQIDKGVPTLYYTTVEAWRIRAIAKVTAYSGGGMLIDAIIAAVDAIVDPLEKATAEEVFFGGNTLDRNSALLNSMATGLGLTNAELDDLFVQATEITV